MIWGVDLPRSHQLDEASNWGTGVPGGAMEAVVEKRSKRGHLDGGG
jgi:hypothetical protein